MVEWDRTKSRRIASLCSRRLERSTKWSLDLRVANLLFDIWGQPTVDLFATQLNNNVKAVFSRLTDPVALQGNSLQADWLKGLLYMYPPLPLLSLARHKGKGSFHLDFTAVAVKRVVLPSPAAPMDLPVMLPECGSLLLAPGGTEFPDLGVLRLAAWKLSGDLYTAEVFRKKLLPPYVQLIDRRRELCTTPSGSPFVAGVPDGRRNPFTRLSEWC